jgi:hypothetical protein
MDKSKFFLKSRGIWGGLVPVILGTLALFGIQVEPGMEEEAIGLGNQAIDVLSQSADSLALIVAGALSLWSRLRQERLPLTPLPTPTPSE